MALRSFSTRITEGTSSKVAGLRLGEKLSSNFHSWSIAFDGPIPEPTRLKPDELVYKKW